jgi:hypothetical protein
MPRNSKISGEDLIVNVVLQLGGSASAKDITNFCKKSASNVKEELISFYIKKAIESGTLKADGNRFCTKKQVC